MECQRKLWIAAVVCAAGSVACFSALARGDDAKARAAWAWAQFGVGCGEACKPNAAWVWASVPVEPAQPALKSAKELGLEWRVQKDYIALVRPGRCVGTHCTPDTLVGGWRDGEYRPFAGGKWGKPTEPPCEPPVSEAAKLLAGIVAGLIVEGFSDEAPESIMAGPLVSASPVAVERRIAAPVRRLLALPIRAIRLARAHRAAARSAAISSAIAIAAQPVVVTRTEWIVPSASVTNRVRP